MGKLTPINIRSLPGIKRDGTRFEGGNYVDGQWCRWQRELPRKIGGYRQFTRFITGTVRQFYTQARSGFVYTHVGHENGLQRFTLDGDGNAGAPIDRTPVGYIAATNRAWNFDAMFDGAGSSTVIFANGPTTLLDISNVAPQDIYYGDIYGADPLAPLVEATSGLTLQTAGNIVVLHPYLFILDANGYVRWSDANDPGNFSSGDSGDGYITAAKLVKGLPLRGGGQSPAGLIWSLDALIRVTYTGGTDIFRFDTITSQSSILAVNGVIEYDGIYFWIGLDRFLMYNGVVREVPNNMNINYFFDGLNFAYANKIFAVKVPRFGEIWWCYPRGDATECSHAVIYNVRENSWYDTELPNGGRSAGIYAQVYQSPLMAGVETSDPAAGVALLTEDDEELLAEDGEELLTDTGETSYKLWRHEVGVDEIDGQSVNAIRSYFETGDISLMTSSEPQSRSLMVQALEPDFVQSGIMSFRVTGRINARSPEVLGEIKQFPPVATQPYEQLIQLNEQRRELRFWFESNTVGGDYQLGDTLAHVEPQDGRYQS